MAAKSPEILADVARYYADRLACHGQTPQGVDWNSADSQQLRFRQLAKLFAGDDNFSLHDLGCGYGALLDYLEGMTPGLRYQGYDIAEDMIHAARDRHRDFAHADFHLGSAPAGLADYSVASGIFNVRLRHGDDAWRDYLLETLQLLHDSSRKGFAFNCLSGYADREKMRADLYYADPCSLFDYCKRHFSPHVALLHDYGLYEFTLLVRKTL